MVESTIFKSVPSLVLTRVGPAKGCDWLLLFLGDLFFLFLFFFFLLLLLGAAGCGLLLAPPDSSGLMIQHGTKRCLEAKKTGSLVSLGVFVSPFWPLIKRVGSKKYSAVALPVT